MEPVDQPDDILVREVLSGHRERFEALVSKYYHAAYAVAYSRTSNSADAQDVTQEAFLRAFTSLNTLRDRSRFGAWLTGIARNVAHSLVRADRKTNSRPTHREELTSKPEAETRDVHEFLRSEIARLDDNDREVLMMHYFTGLSTREIGDALGITRESAKKRLQRAREALSERVIAELGDALRKDRPTDEKRSKSWQSLLLPRFPGRRYLPVQPQPA